jgi:hypothetical protein
MRRAGIRDVDQCTERRDRLSRPARLNLPRTFTDNAANTVTNAVRSEQNVHSIPRSLSELDGYISARLEHVAGASGR